jgi:hypothetical protein
VTPKSEGCGGYGPDGVGHGSSAIGEIDGGIYCVFVVGLLDLATNVDVT